MTHALGRVVLTGAFLVVLAPSARSGSALEMRVAPTRVTAAPGWLEVRAVVEASADNRALEVVAESNTYFRSSELPLDGARAPRFSEVLFKGLPQGEYVVTVTLVGLQRRRAVESKWFQVAPGLGH